MLRFALSILVLIVLQSPLALHSQAAANSPILMYAGFLPIHAILMSVSFLLMLSGMIISRYLKKRRWWLKVHRAVGLTGGITGILGIVIAAYMVGATTGIHLRVGHSIVGLITVLVIILTPILGFVIFSAKPEYKKRVRLFHRWSGRITLIMMAVTITFGLFFVFGSGGTKGPKQVEQFTNSKGYQQISSAGITLQWKVSGDSLEVILAAPSAGWVAVGFDPSSMMQDANLIIGYVNDGTVVVRDDFGTWFTSHESDEALGGTNDVTIRGGKESDDGTEISFVMPLDSGDRYDKSLQAGKSYSVLLAYGKDDNPSSMHAKKTKVNIEL